MTTSRSLISRTLRGEKVERVGSYDGPWDDTLAAWVEQGYPTRKVSRDIGEKCWHRTDGRWIDVIEAGEYEEPVPPWEHWCSCPPHSPTRARPWLICGDSAGSPTRAASLQGRLCDEYPVEVPIIEWNGQPLVRVSVQGYDTAQNVIALVEALRVSLGLS